MNNRGAAEISPRISDRLSAPRHFGFGSFFYDSLVLEEAYYCPPTHTHQKQAHHNLNNPTHTHTHRRATSVHLSLYKSLLIHRALLPPCGWVWSLFSFNNKYCLHAKTRVQVYLQWRDRTEPKKDEYIDSCRKFEIGHGTWMIRKHFNVSKVDLLTVS